MIGGGVLIGMSLACTVGGHRDVGCGPRGACDSALVRCSAWCRGAGSLGALLSAPLGQILNEGYGWRMGLSGFVVLSLLMIPAAWYAGRWTRSRCPQARG